MLPGGDLEAEADLILQGTPVLAKKLFKRSAR